MAYNKDNYEERRLTAKQEKFCQEIASGATQREAMLKAYPSRKNWTQQSLDVAASQLMNNKLIIRRLSELRASTEKKVIWNRTRALNEINYVLEMNKKDMARIQDAYQDEIDMLEGKILQITASIAECKDMKQVIAKTKEVQDISEKIAKLKKQKRVNSTNINGILNATKILNRMYGLDITKVEVTTTDTERDNMKSLSKEELKALAYANINTRNPEQS